MRPTDEQLTAPSIHRSIGSIDMEGTQKGADRRVQGSVRSDDRSIVAWKDYGAVQCPEVGSAGITTDCTDILVQTKNAKVDAMVTWQQKEDRSIAKMTNVRINTVVDWQKNELKVMWTPTPGPVCNAKADASAEKEELTNVKDDKSQMTNSKTYKLNCSSAATLGNAAVRTVAPVRPVQYSCCRGETPRSNDGVKIPGLLLGRPPDSFSNFFFRGG